MWGLLTEYPYTIVRMVYACEVLYLAFLASLYRVIRKFLATV
jgi:hypothetical protein